MTRLLSLLCLLGVLSAGVQAEQKKDFGNYEIHYSVVPTRFVPADVAKNYGITRGKSVVMLNISVRRKTPEDPLQQTVAHAARVTGQRHDLIRPYELDFREIREQGGIYYLADFRLISEEHIRFEIKVEIDGEQPYEFEFTKTLYIEP